jgi:hypothetical protein
MNLGTGIIGGARPAEIVFTHSEQATQSASSYTFSNVPIGTAHASRRLVIWSDRGNTSSVTVNGVAATFITGTNRCYVIDVPTGTTATIVINAASQNHCALVVFAMYYTKSATPVSGGVVFLTPDTTNPKSTTIGVQKGGVVASFVAGGGLGASMTYSFGGNLVTDLSDSQSENTCIGAGHGAASATDAAWAISVTRSGTNNNFSLQALSFR